MTKQFIYQTELQWTEQKKGVVSALGKPSFEVAVPPEFKGHEGIWTPEDLFVSSVNVCLMATFLYYAETEKLIFKSYKSSCRGVLEKTGAGFMFTTIELNSHIIVGTEGDISKAKQLLEQAEKHCLISNSIKSQVILTPLVEV